MEPEIQAAAEALRNGELVAFATETVYGLGANALDADAVAKIFETKGRPKFDPLIVHVPDLLAAREVTKGWPAEAELLAEVFWPGPLTLVLHKAEVVPDLVTAGLPTVAVRAPDHALAQRLLRTAGIPIAAPSANRFGGISPTRAEHVAQAFSGIRILDGGPCRVGLESTIVSFAEGRPALLRPGGVVLADIEKVVGKLLLPENNTRVEESPGRQSRHYAPGTPLTLVRPRTLPARSAYLAWCQPPADADTFVDVEVLSQSGDAREAATRLFACLRRLDALGVDLIVAEPVPREGLGLAIMDRLSRAAHA